MRNPSVDAPEAGGAIVDCIVIWPLVEIVLPVRAPVRVVVPVTANVLLNVVAPEAVSVPVLIFPKDPVIVGEVMVGELIVGEVKVGEVAKTNSPVPVDEATKAEVSPCHSFEPFAGLVSTVLAKGAVCVLFVPKSVSTAIIASFLLSSPPARDGELVILVAVG